MDADLLGEILRSVLRLPDMIVVTGPGDPVTECMVRPGRVRVDVDGAWITIESDDWHVHLGAARIERLKFRRVPDPHDRAREALYVSFADKEGRSLLRVHFDRSHDEAGRLLGERLEAFETLRARHGRFVHPDDG